MKNVITDIESIDAPSAPLTSNNLSRVKMWVSGFTSTRPVSRRKGRAVPRVFVDTRDVVGRLGIALSTYAAT